MTRGAEGSPIRIRAAVPEKTDS
jgi:hypothetical protein